MYVARPLVYVKGLYFIREYIPERNHINVMCVERPLVKKQGVQFIRPFILERNRIHVKYVAVAILKINIFNSLENSYHINVMYVAILESQYL